MNDKGDIQKHNLQKPFFEIGPKTFLYGAEALALAVEADRVSEIYGVEIIFTAQYTDIAPIAKHTKNLRIFSQHMDGIYPGKGVGAVLPEAVKEAGAAGVLLNHAEKPLTLTELSICIARAHEVGLMAMVCAGTPEEGAAVACLGPDIVLAESPKLIGKGARGPEDMAEIKKINDSIYKINEEMLILHGAGISDESDVYEIILAGADATGSTSGIMKADRPIETMEKMIAAVAKAWQLRTAK